MTKNEFIHWLMGYIEAGGKDMQKIANRLEELDTNYHIGDPPFNPGKITCGETANPWVCEDGPGARSDSTLSPGYPYK